MDKFGKLIQNEFVKLFKRKAIWIMVGVVILTAFLTTMSYRITYEAPPDIASEEKQWQIQRDSIDTAVFATDEYGEYLDKSAHAYEQRSTFEMLDYLLKNKVSAKDWRYTKEVIQNMYKTKLAITLGDSSTETADLYARLKDMVENDNWRAYYREEKTKALRNYEGVSDYMKQAAVYEFDYHLNHNLRPGDTPWKDNLIQSVADAKRSLASYQEKQANSVSLTESEQKAMSRLIDQIAIGEYQLDKGIENNAATLFEPDSDFNVSSAKSKFWRSFLASSSMIMIIGVMVIVVAGGIVASEFSQGTVKFLLVNPVKRWKILMAKYATVVITGLGFTLLLYICSGILSAIFCGEGIGDMIIKANNGKAYATSPFLAVLGRYALSWIEVLVISTMSFAISALMRSVPLAVGVGLFTYLAGNLFVTLFAALGLDWARYFIFSNLNLADIAAGNTVFANQTIGTAVCVILAHMVVFLLTAWDAFTRKEV